MTVPEFESLLAGDHELRRMELKGAGMVRGNKRLVAKVARAAMAMGNLRDGGLVVIGIDDNQVSAKLPGLNDAEFGEWSDFDLVSAQINQYSDPPVSFELHRFNLTNNARVVVLEVAEFEHDPHVCKKNFEDVLKDGQIYIRGRRMPESVPIPSSAEGRELLNLAIDKGVREFVRRAGAAGIPLGPAISPGELDARAYAVEFDEAWAAPTPVTRPAAGVLLPGVARPGYSDVAVRPGTYDPERLNPGELERFVVEHAVSMRGWPVPFIDHRENVQRHGAWVGQDVAAGGALAHGEAWRIFTSGQFLHRRILATDLRDAGELRPSVATATGAVAVWDVLLYMVEVAEFGARAATSLGLDQVTFDVALVGMAGRQLISGDFMRELHGPYLVDSDRLRSTVNVEVTALLENPRGVGVDLAQRLLRQFGLNVPDEVLFEQQESIFNRR